MYDDEDRRIQTHNYITMKLEIAEAEKWFQ
jgi:hypothetical protein